MGAMPDTRRSRRGLALIAGAAVLAGWAFGAVAQSASQDQILEALTPKPRLGATRSLSRPAEPPPVSPVARENAAFIEGLQARAGGSVSRSLSRDERQKLAEVSAGQPTIDLEIPFEFNSAVIGGRALPAVKNLGAALASAQLRGGTFMIAGHTDAKGGEQFNQALSERRAESVKQYIVDTYKVPAANLLTVGYGKARLKNATDPMGSENRRVQTTNISEVKSAGR